MLLIPLKLIISSRLEIPCYTTCWYMYYQKGRVYFFDLNKLNELIIGMLRIIVDSRNSTVVNQQLQSTILQKCRPTAGKSMSARRLVYESTGCEQQKIDKRMLLARIPNSV